MEDARYFVPEHPTLTEVYSRDELRAFLQRGLLSRSDMICDDETGLAHLLGDLLSLPYRDATLAPSRSTRSSARDGQANTPSTNSHEFRADTPLTPAHRHPATPRLPRAEDEAEDANNHRHQSHLRRQRMDADDDDQVEGAPDINDIDADPNDFEEDQHLRPFNPFSNADLPDFDEEEPLPGDPYGSSASAYSQHHNSLSPQSMEEELLYLGHPSWLAFPKCLLGFALFAAATIYAFTAHIGLEWVMLLGSIAGLFLVFITLERTTTTYFVTSHRIEMEYGMIGRSTKEVRIRDIRAIDVQQRGYKALLGLGTVEFDSSASSGPEVIFTNVRRPHQIKELVRSLQLHH